jgi:hypothetical protein
VEFVNTAPEFNSDPPVMIDLEAESSYFYFFPNIYEPDGSQEVSLEIADAPAFLTLYGSDYFSILPITGQEGTYEITITLTDDWETPGVTEYTMEI